MNKYCNRLIVTLFLLILACVFVFHYGKFDGMTIHTQYLKYNSLDRGSSRSLANIHLRGKIGGTLSSLQVQYYWK